MNIPKLIQTSLIFLIVAFGYCWIVFPLMVSTVIKVAEPYEIDRVKRYWQIAKGFAPEPFDFVVVLVGMSFMGVSSNAGDSNPTLKITIMLFGFLFFVLGMKWYMESKKGYRLPKSGSL